MFWKQIWQQHVEKLLRLQEDIIYTLPASYSVKNTATNVEFAYKYVKNQP